jgi:hypothetical protein
MDKCCERDISLDLRMERVSNELSGRGLVERAKENLIDRGTAFPDFLKGDRQRVIGANLLFPVRAENKEMLVLRISHQEFHQFERSEIRPLEIVDKENERVILLSNGTNKALEDVVEPVLRFSRRELLNGWLIGEQELELGKDGNKNLRWSQVH